MVARELTGALPQVNGVAFVGFDLQARIYFRDQNSVSQQDFTMLPRAIKIFATSLQSREANWMRSLLPPTVGKPIIALVMHLFRGDELVGIHLPVITLAEFSDSITTSITGCGLTPYVLYSNDWLSAHPAIAGWTPAVSLFTDYVSSTILAYLYGARERCTYRSPSGSYE